MLMLHFQFLKYQSCIHVTDPSSWKQDLHGARVDPRPEEAGLLQDRS